jgi:hypothetical protein
MSDDFVYNVVSIEGKPAKPKSSYAIVGLFKRVELRPFDRKIKRAFLSPMTPLDNMPPSGGALIFQPPSSGAGLQ